MPGSITINDLFVLIIEDTPMFQKMATRRFEKAGISPDHILVANDGSEGLEKYREIVLRENAPPPFIYMDGAMPKKGGAETTIEIRLIEQNLGRRASFIMGCSATEVPFAGVDEYLEKQEFTLERLQRFIQNFINRLNGYAPIENLAARSSVYTSGITTFSPPISPQVTEETSLDIPNLQLRSPTSRR